MGLDVTSALGGLAAGAALSCLLPRPPAKPPLRAAFVMQLNGDEHLAEYKKRHDGTDPHWDGPKAHLHKTLSGNGVRNYSIFHLPDTNQLFAYAEQVPSCPLLPPKLGSPLDPGSAKLSQSCSSQPSDDAAPTTMHAC